MVALPMSSLEQVENSKIVRICSGEVKWFDPVKGFGFARSPEEERDILLHAQVLRESGWQILYQGVTVSCEYVETERGLQATKILSVEPDTLGRANFAAVTGQSSVSETGGFITASIKWYSDERGYGFLTSGLGTPDIFLHADVVRRAGRESMSVGELVEVRMSMRPQGLVALELRELVNEQQKELGSSEVQSQNPVTSAGDANVTDMRSDEVSPVSSVTEIRRG